jgi:4-hydroxybenzoate polyprenyltransferase
MPSSQSPSDGGVSASIQWIFVALEGTLISTDLLAEGIIKAVCRDIRTLYRLPKWALKGRPSLRTEIEARVEIDAAHLPYRRDLLDHLRAMKAKGSRLVLVTDSTGPWSAAIADEINLFDDVIARDAQSGINGSKSLAAIEEYSREHNVDCWGYVGDDRTDLEIWKAASAIYVVCRKLSVPEACQAAGKLIAVFRPSQPFALAVIKGMRPQQWVKNTLVFVPFVAGHNFTSSKKLLLSILAFVCYSACASSIYLANDLFDLDSDRRHPKKALRPFASGALPVAFGFPLSALLFIVGMLLSLLSPSFLFPEILLSYVLLSGLYSCWLKAKPIIDIIVLAVLYALRIFAGGAAAEIKISEWLMAFSLFLFTSLALAKRHAELRRLSTENRRAATGRGYLVSDLGLLEIMGMTSGFQAVLVIALYINSPETRVMYRHPDLLWFLCPLLLHWIGRLWLYATRGYLDEDPIVYAITDRVSLIGAALALSVILISYLNW